ncbi:serine/threonine protein phosphatase [Halobacteriales archaeon QS_4_66_20]|nr:MAG: serine/threonine protein phosphatase [Halobacteriales archaeon QS_4_66_20]
MHPPSTGVSKSGGSDYAGTTRTCPTFDGELDALHRRIDPDRYDTIYVVGDAHGCIDELQDLLAELQPAEDDLVLFVGDLVRKGPDGRAVLDLVRSSPNMLSVRGNNEQKFIDGEVPADRFDDVFGYLESMPAAASFGDSLVVHAGIDPRRALSEQSLHDLLETRAVPPENGYDGPFWFESYEGPPRVFFGHTVLSEPFATEWAVGLDTGCVHGRELTAYDCSAREFVRVPARKTYQHRDQAEIVDPWAWADR